MLHLSLPDPNYRIKGSRDPLGFQPIWQRLGRNIIEHLSTVSVNVRDFQVMSYAYYFFGDDDKKDFLDFFYRWEQICAYTREKTVGDGYNGKNFVSKKMRDTPDGPFSLGSNSEDTILSNQKAYGIYGKYNRPYTEMGIRKKENFASVLHQAVNQHPNKTDLYALIKKLKSKETKVLVGLDELQLIYPLIASLSDQEKVFYDELILQSSEDHSQNEIYTLIHLQQELLEANTPFKLYNVIDTLIQNSNTSEILKGHLEEIRHAEKLLYIYTNVFRHLQTKATWKIENMLQEIAISTLPRVDPYHYSIDDLNQISKSINGNPTQLLIDIVQRNNDICKKRNNAAWLEITDNRIVRHYKDGARELKEWNINEQFDNDYFIASYLRLYRDIKQSA